MKKVKFAVAALLLFIIISVLTVAMASVVINGVIYNYNQKNNYFLADAHNTTQFVTIPGVLSNVSDGNMNFVGDFDVKLDDFCFSNDTALITLRVEKNYRYDIPYRCFYQ